VTVRFGRPIETAALTIDDRDRLVARVRGVVADLLQERG
jgi:Trp operon repressor